MIVATIERIESFATPKTPCPEVHPEPSCVPKPVSKPPIIIIAGLESKVIIDFLSNSNQINAPNIIPKRNSNLHNLSSKLHLNKPPMTLLIPATLSVKYSKIQIDNPINSPPKTAEKGVKLSKIITSNYYYNEK